MKIRSCIALVGAAFVASCVWIQPTEEGAKVKLVEEAEVANCKKLGSTTSYVKWKISGHERPEEKVRKELITVAMNEAPRMGGNTIVALGEPEEGAMGFAVYHCPE